MAMDKWLDAPEPSLDQMRSHAKVGYVMWLVVVGMMVVGMIALVAYRIAADGDLEPSSPLVFLAFMFAVQAFAMLSREAYKRRQLEERVAALERKR